MQDFLFWWSVVSTILGVLLLCFSIWQYKEGENQKEKIKAQVKVWMQQANGLQQSLNRVVNDNLNKRYSSTDDVCNTIWAIERSAFSLYQSLYEERCVTEEEYKEHQNQIASVIQTKQIEELKGVK